MNIKSTEVYKCKKLFTFVNFLMKPIEKNIKK